ncbi:MAG: hypothetical protein Q7K55_02355 [Candidatus Levybacteria bacterium]|nr:hypothetical protein [Candidatus Levybacteria bacterium]
MGDFKFLENPLSKKWVILAPRRAKRPDVAKGFEPVCPFCLGREKDEPDVYRVGGEAGDSNWQIRVLNNKFPFAPVHEVIIHSSDHHKNFEELSPSQVELIIKTYKQRYNTHKEKGQVYIFHNRGEGGGESLPHPHTQLAVIPFEIKINIPRLDPSATAGVGPKPLGINISETGLEKETTVETEHFYMFCPKTSQWPDEIWLAPKKRGRAFGEITDEEISDFSNALTRLIQIFDLRHGNEFPFNFYIYPGGDWYLRLIPRLKTLGGFEIGTGIYINTQDPNETIDFIKEHFENPDEEKIKNFHQAEYEKRA